MIYIRHTYRTSSQSSSLHNQPSWTSELLHSTLQQNTCTSLTFPVTLWPWVNIKIIQIGIKLLSLIVFSTIPSLKQTTSQVSWYITTLNIYFIKSRQLSSLPWILFVQNNLWWSFCLCACYSQNFISCCLPHPAYNPAQNLTITLIQDMIHTQ